MFVAERHINPALSRSADETEWSENLDGFSTYHAGSTLSKDDAMSKVWSWLDIPILLSLIGLSSAMLSFATKTVLMYNANVRQYILSFIPVEFQWPAFCIYCVFMSLLACYVSQLICKESVGGGLADMKTILGGVVKPVLLSRKLIVAKTLGLWLSLMGGLSVGREGPFVHVSGAIADQLMKLEPFRHIHRQDSKRLEILACACASGVSATFGNAFGGVLFSIEFTSSAYMVRTLPKAFLTSVVAMLAFLFLGVSDELALFRDENQSIYILPTLNEMVVFFLLGLGGGLLGIVFVLLVELITTLRKALLDPKTLSRGTVELRRYVLVGAVTLLVSSAMHVELSRVPHAKRGSFGLLQFLFSADKINPDMLSSLALFGVYKFFATILSVTLPLPVGLFSPTFVIGGLLGRVLGEVLQFHPDFRGYAPWEYALLGAAAFSTGVTRAISTSVIIFELACQPHLGLPLSVVVLTAHFTGNRFSKNVYDVLVEATGGPVMDDLPESLYTVPAGSVMMPIKEHHVLALDSTYADAAALLQATEPARVGLDRHASNGIYLDSEGEVQQQVAVALGDDTPNKHSQLGQSRELSEDGLARNTAAAASMDQASGLDRGEGVEMPSQPVAAHVVVGERQPLLASTGRQYQVKCRRLGDAQRQGTVVRHYYAPTVIPVVQSKASMVIVGAVLRKDVKEALCKLEKLREVALAAPVMLGRVEEGEVDTYGSMQQQRGSSSSWGSQGMHVISSGELGSQLLAPSADTAIFNEIIQFIIVTEGGRSIQPVVNASHKRRTHRRSISFHSLPMAIPIDPSPYQIVDTMHLSKVDMVFRLLSLNQAYVTNSGRVVGIVTRSLLREFLGGRGKRPTDRCKKFLLDMWASVCGGTPPHSQPPVLGL